MSELAIQQLGDAVIFTVKVVPGSSKTEMVGLLNGKIKIRVSAAPEKGKANKVLVDFLAKKLGIKSKAVSIISGHKSTIKQVRISGVQAKSIKQMIKSGNVTGTSK
jgi:uncharacterized protein (TIGR00251 family)